MRTKKSANPNEGLKMIWRTPVVGLSHYDYALVAKEITVGDELDLAAVTTNGMDNEAVSISRNGEQIGWLPNNDKTRQAKSIIFRMLSHDVEIRVKVISHDSAAPLDSRLYAGLYIRVL